MERAHAYIEDLAQLIELLGVGIILGAVAAATLWFVWQAVRSRDLTAAYQGYRANLGRGILLGLELLVGADIIGTIRPRRVRPDEAPGHPLNDRGTSRAAGRRSHGAPSPVTAAGCPCCRAG